MTDTSNPLGHSAEPAGLSLEWAALLGMHTQEEPPKPSTLLDWALQWGRGGISVFPCQRFLGTPLVDKWYSEATTLTSKIVHWWADDPEADIAGVPDRSGHFVVLATGDEGRENLAALEAERGPLPAELRYFNHHGDLHLWLRGEVLTSHHRLGRNVHVLGRGHYVYLPESWAPCRVWK